MNLNKIIYAYDRDGLIASINSILSKIGIKFRIKNQIEHRQNFLLKTIANKSDIKVLQGPFKGMKLTKDFKWDKAPSTGTPYTWDEVILVQKLAAPLPNTDCQNPKSRSCEV